MQGASVVISTQRNRDIAKVMQDYSLKLAVSMRLTGGDV
jgi:hypothetical protein